MTTCSSRDTTTLKTFTSCMVQHIKEQQIFDSANRVGARYPDKTDHHSFFFNFVPMHLKKIKKYFFAVYR